MVRHAFRVLTDDAIATRLLAFSDDMDGLRKTPDNIPNRELIAGQSRQAADAKCPIRSANTTASPPTTMRGCARFLDSFGFDYEFASSTAYYKSGQFDAALLHMLKRFDAVQTIMLPSLARGARGDLFAVPADPSAHPHCHAGSARRLRRRGGHHPLARSRHERGFRDAGHRRPLQAAMEAGLGDALVRARRRLRDGRQGPDRLGQAVVADRAARSAGRRPRVSITNCSSTRRGRRSRSRRATA